MADCNCGRVIRIPNQSRSTEIQQRDNATICDAIEKVASQITFVHAAIFSGLIRVWTHKRVPIDDNTPKIISARIRRFYQLHLQRQNQGNNDWPHQ